MIWESIMSTQPSVPAPTLGSQASARHTSLLFVCVLDCRTLAGLGPGLKRSIQNTSSYSSWVTDAPSTARPCMRVIDPGFISQTVARTA